jgi:hypothetical protein
MERRAKWKRERRMMKMEMRMRQDILKCAGDVVGSVCSAFPHHRGMHAACLSSGGMCHTCFVTSSQEDSHRPPQSTIIPAYTRAAFKSTGDQPVQLGTTHTSSSPVAAWVGGKIECEWCDAGATEKTRVVVTPLHAR